MSSKAGVLLAASCLILGGCIDSSDNERLQPSQAPSPFGAAQFQDFADYVSQTRRFVSQYKVYLDPENAPAELAAAMPFELDPAESCTADKPERGILLIHGLSDSPFAMRDLAQAFADRCFLVRAILLPGHGTRAGDLLAVSRTDWLNSARFGLDTLKGEAEQVFAGGFSLGGLLATHLAMDDPELAGIFAFSPALSLQHAWQLRQTIWLRHLVAWVDTDAPDDFARYEAMPMNGLAQIYLLTEELRERLDLAPLEVPVFLAQSMDDAVIDAEANTQDFASRFASPMSVAINYARDPERGAVNGDPRIRYVNSHLPEQRIVGFSHQSVHISPTNPHYGPEGEYRNCGGNSGHYPAEVERCMNAENLWWTETIGDVAPALPDSAIAARLTFNPLFEELMASIDAFLDSIEPAAPP